MTALRDKLVAIRDSGRKALSFFVTAGFPRAEDTAAVVEALAEGGADLVELGIPFSDPLADGPVIQAASHRALEGGMTLARTLDLAAELRERVAIPIVLMGYANPIVRMGMEEFFRRCGRIGVAGTIIPDVPLEESAEYRRLAGEAGVAAVFLAAPTSPDERLRQLDEASEGFLYCVSVTGVTGTRAGLAATAGDFLRRARAIVHRNPLLVGFGVSTPADAAAVAAISDGVIIGSALLRHIESLPPQKLAREVANFARDFRRAMDARL